MLRPHFVQAYRNAKCRTELDTLRIGKADGSSLPAGDAAVFALMRRFELSRREADVLVQLAEGKTNIEISETLSISVSTVKTRLENIYYKLNVNTRTAAALRALKESVAELQTR